MGMFDYVNVEIDCPKCGEAILDFQSKDSRCELLRIDPNVVDTFYGSCGNCNYWVEYSRELPIKKARSERFNLYEIEDMGFELKPD